MTRGVVETWLAAREPQRPPALAEQMTRAIEACPATALAAAPSVAEAMGLLGTWTLASISSAQGQSPELALELLSADAFVTYAFEAAAEERLDISGLSLRLLKAAA